MQSLEIVNAANVGLLIELSIVIALAAILLLPGWSILTVSNFGRRWPLFERFALAVGLSVTFYPILFYNLRFWLPDNAINGWIQLALLAMFGLVILAVHHYHGWHFSRISPLGLAAFGVVGLTILTRLAIAHRFPIPAWTDSLHHVLITQFTVEQGQLPLTLEPYFPIDLTMYHLGLYSLSASVEWLTGAASHTALQWTAQVLNGLCGLGIYLVLKPHVGKVGAIGGMITVGLLAHQPAYYANWGRYTQIASQTILLIAWAVILYSMNGLVEPKSISESPHSPRRGINRSWIWPAIFAGLLSAGVFLLHFRVAALYIALLLASVPWYLYLAYRRRRLRQTASFLVIVGAVALLAIFPTLWQALNAYVTLGQNRPVITDAAQIQSAVNSYYVFPWASIPMLSARPWLLITAALAATIGLLRRNSLTVMVLIWTLLIIGIGNAYLLDIQILKLTNLGTILIMLYMPIGLLIGVALGEIDRFMDSRQVRWARIHKVYQFGLVVVLLCAGLYGGWQRTKDIEPGRYFVQESDLEAIAWIAEKTPQDSLIAVNTTFWLPGTPHGTDAGYWIPYFTGRKMTLGPMLMVLAPYEYRIDVIELSRAVVDLEVEGGALEMLRQRGVNYIFVGALSQQNGTGLSVDRLNESDMLEEVFRQDGSAIFQITNK